MTIPTTCPRSSGPASVDASGTTICATTDSAPAAASATASTPKLGAAAHAASAVAVPSRIVVISRRRSMMSPSGTRNARPQT